MTGRVTGGWRGSSATRSRSAWCRRRGWSAGALGFLAAVLAFFAVLALALALAAGRLAAAWEGEVGARRRRCRSSPATR